jgi:hypothetical protein
MVILNTKFLVVFLSFPIPWWRIWDWKELGIIINGWYWRFR